MTRPFLFLPLILLSSCTLVRPNEVFQIEQGKYGFTQEEERVMHEEADRICDLTEGAYCPLLTHENVNNRITKTSTSLGDAPGRTDVNRTLETANVIVIIRPGLDASAFKRTFMHEMGHAGGCWEHLQPGTVMSGNLANEPEEWTQEDLKCINRGW